jgi:hypothetical protein
MDRLSVATDVGIQSTRGVVALAATVVAVERAQAPEGKDRFSQGLVKDAAAS